MSDDHKTSVVRPFLFLRHPVSGLTHLLGAIVAAYFVFEMVTAASAHRTIWHVVSFAVFGISMTLLFTSSALYHLLHLSEEGTAKLRRLDHSMIYLFIAGTYTPVCLVVLRESKGLMMFCLVWLVAMLGILAKIIWFESSRWLRIGLYVAMSFLSLFILPEIWQHFPRGALIWLLVGGLAYLVGAVVYASKRPDPFPTVFGFHEIWHIFVLIGAFSHLWVMKNYVFYF